MFLKQLNLNNARRLCVVVFMAGILLQTVTWLVGDSSSFIASAYAEEEKKKKKKLTKAQKEAKLKYKNAVSQRRKSVGTSWSICGI